MLRAVVMRVVVVVIVRMIMVMVVRMVVGGLRPAPMVVTGRLVGGGGPCHAAGEESGQEEDGGESKGRRGSKRVNGAHGIS